MKKTKQYCRQNTDALVEKKASFVDIFFSAWVAYIVAIVAYIILGTFVFLVAYIPSESMASTLQTGDKVLCTRLFTQDDIGRYDVITFQYPDDESELFIKRVIGMPGEVIEVKDGHVYADGTLLSEEFIKEEMIDKLGAGTYEVPEGYYFVLGDNRNNSNDSRFWKNKYVSYDKIRAKALCLMNWKLTPI